MNRLICIAILGSVAGCVVETPTCTPECPKGYYCDGVTGCLPYDRRDMTLPPGQDLTGADLTVDPCARCSGMTPYCNAMKVCVPCLLDTHCPLGLVCRSIGHGSVCVPGCASDDRCGPGPGLRCCGGSCIDVAKDPNNCGACDTKCGGAHVRFTCIQGVCEIGVCDNGWGDCNAMPVDGCETNLSASADHCGGCRMPCLLAHAKSGCAKGCYVVGCDVGYDDCNGAAKDGCEVLLLTDASNCGACGKACAKGKICVNAQCT